MKTPEEIWENHRFKDCSFTESAIAAIREAAKQERERMLTWNPIATAPKDGRYILLAGPSGYRSTPLRVEVCKFVPEYGGNEWRNHGGDPFRDGGESPTHWMPLPTVKETND